MAAEESGFPGIVDVHAHLAAPEFEDDLGEVLDSAAGADLAAIVAVSTTPEDAPRVLSIAKEHSMVFPCIGLHPCDVTAERIDGILALLDRHADTIVGVGECGLDYMCVPSAKMFVLPAPDCRLRAGRATGPTGTSRRSRTPSTSHSRAKSSSPRHTTSHSTFTPVAPAAMPFSSWWRLDTPRPCCTLLTVWARRGPTPRTR